MLTAIALLLSVVFSPIPSSAQSTQLLRLAEQLQHPEVAMRRQAARSLGRIGESHSVTLLRLAANKEPEASIRLEIVHGLQNIAFLRLAGYRDALGAIGQSSDPAVEVDPVVRLRAVRALWEAGERDLLDPVPYLNRALDDPNAQVSLTAVRMLRKLGTPQTIAPLARAAADRNQDQSIRLKAIQALGAVALDDGGPVGRQVIEANADRARRLGSTPFTSPRALIPWHQIQIRHLSALANQADNSPTLVLAAVKAMGKVKDKSAVPTLRKIAADHTNPTVRLQASQVLSHVIARQYE